MTNWRSTVAKKRHGTRCAIAAATLTLGCAIIGCSGSGGGGRGGGELSPDKFYRGQSAGPDDRRHTLDERPEPAMYNQVHVNVIGPSEPLLPVARDEPPSNGPVTEISGASRELAEGATGHGGAASHAGATTGPTTRAVQVQPREVVPAGMAGAGGQYQTIGGVVVRVNNQPIFADKVLQAITPVLAAEAKQRDPESFRKFAEHEIEQQLAVMVNGEVLYAQAQQNLDSEEKNNADLRTMMWRQQQITKAGGSIEQARAAAAAEGKSFDEMVNDQHRIFMVGLYYQKKIFPRAEVTATDMRRFYDHNNAKLFSEADSVQFRLIRVDVKQAGRDDAVKKITGLRDRVRSGEDFATLAGQFSDDTRLAKNGGLEEPIQRGSYAQAKIEDAAWKLQVGQVSDVIETPKAFYLLKVESRKAGHTQPFEDPVVQARIKEILQKERMAPLAEAEQRRLRAQSAIEPDPPLITPVVEMAMQNYPRWSQQPAPATQPARPQQARR